MADERARTYGTRDKPRRTRRNVTKTGETTDMEGKLWKRTLKKRKTWEKCGKHMGANCGKTQTNIRQTSDKHQTNMQETHKDLGENGRKRMKKQKMKGAKRAEGGTKPSVSRPCGRVRAGKLQRTEVLRCCFWPQRTFSVCSSPVCAVRVGVYAFWGFKGPVLSLGLYFETYPYAWLTGTPPCDLFAIRYVGRWSSISCSCAIPETQPVTREIFGKRLVLQHKSVGCMWVCQFV